MFTVGSMLRASCRTHADRTAIVYRDEAMTYRDYWSAVRRLAARLQSSGLGPGDRIAVISRNAPEYLVAYGAAEVFGFVLVPVNFRLSTEEMAWILVESGARAVFAEGAILADRAGTLRQSVPGVVEWVAWRGAVPEMEPWDAWLAQATNDAVDWPVDPASPAYLFFTSGTTGRPKGAMLPHRAQMALTLLMSADLQLTPDDRMLLVMPLHHVGGKWQSLAMLSRGAQLVLAPGFDLEEVCRTVFERRISVMLMAPTMVYRILALSEQETRVFSSLNTLLYSSAPMAPALLEEGIRRFGPIFAQIYGSTESGSVTWFSKSDHEMALKTGNIPRLAAAGRPSMGTEVMLLDSDDRPTEADGEICLRAPWVFSGYWRNPAATSATFYQDWLRTGDVGRIDSDGFVYILDRKNDLIISGGENIYPREVEDVLLSHPDVAEAGVAGRPDPEWGQRVAAYVVLQPESHPSEAELIAYCQERLARFKRPRHIHFVQSLPRNSVGKVLRRALAQTPDSP